MLTYESNMQIWIQTNQLWKSWETDSSKYVLETVDCIKES